MIGHAVELYLKATLAKQTGNNSAAIGYGHNIKRLWDACKSNDANFIPEYKIRNIIFDKSRYVDGLNINDWYNDLVASGEVEHYHRNQELYTIAWLLPDLKYTFAPSKVQGRKSEIVSWPHPYWVDFFKAIRCYLDYPGAGRRDAIRFYLDELNDPTHEQSRINIAYTCISYLQEINSPQNI